MGSFILASLRNKRRAGGDLWLGLHRSECLLSLLCLVKRNNFLSRLSSLLLLCSWTCLYFFVFPCTFLPLIFLPLHLPSHLFPSPQAPSLLISTNIHPPPSFQLKYPLQTSPKHHPPKNPQLQESNRHTNFSTSEQVKLPVPNSQPEVSPTAKILITLSFRSFGP